jgi:branched-chain amino acid transport system ATP-binding protein
MSAALAVRHLETWYGPVCALRGVSLEAAAGRMACVLGANGSGKTTLLNTIAGVLDPFKGVVELDGRRIDGRDPDQNARDGLSLVPEGRQVFPFLTVEENLRMGAAASGDLSALAPVHALFPRLRERAGVHAGRLSGGEQQMLAIGRALMARPRLLLLDEPSLGLSPLLTAEIFAAIRRINRESGTTVLVVEQNAAIALATADHGYILENGRIVAAGPCAELAAKQDVREAYLGMRAAGAGERRQRWKRRKTWR